MIFIYYCKFCKHSGIVRGEGDTPEKLKQWPCILCEQPADLVALNTDQKKELSND